MIFTETKLKGAFIIAAERLVDERGFFALSWSQSKFAEKGLGRRLVESNISFNLKKGTLRGMHFQIAPFGQAKLVRCTMGAIYDVALDLRPESPTRYQWVAVELSAENRVTFFIPAGFAHGFQTLTDNTEVFYQMSETYHSEAGRGVRWDDPSFGIEWPSRPTIISTRDQQYPDIIP